MEKASTMEVVRDFAVDHPDKLFMVAQPETDELFISYKGLVMYGRFEGGVVKRAVSEEGFKSAWQQFSSQLMSSVGIDQATGGKFVNGILDGVQTIGETLSANKNQHAKRGKKGGSSRSGGSHRKGGRKG